MQAGIDSQIIESVVKYGEDKFDEMRLWFNCNMHYADGKDFNTFRHLADNLRNNNEMLFKLILVYYFEQVGFDAKITCDKCSKKTSIKRHAVAMIKSFDEVKDCNNFSDIWFEKFANVYRDLFNGKFNEKKLTIHVFESLHNFYMTKKDSLNDLRLKIERSDIEDAFALLMKIRGVGEKVAKFMVRDLIFFFTEWGKQERIPYGWRIENLDCAVPVDRWVRRVTLSIPSLRQCFCELLEDEELDKYVSKAIVEICSKLGINPLRFDFGAYWIGVEVLEKQWKKFERGKQFSKTYEFLKREFRSNYARA